MVVVNLPLELSSSDAIDELTTQICVLEEVRMNGDLGDVECIVWYAASTLIGIVVLRTPDIFVSGRSVKLARRKEVEISMVQAIEGKIDRTNTIDIWWYKSSDIRLTGKESSTIGECAWSFSGQGHYLRERVSWKDESK